MTRSNRSPARSLRFPRVHAPRSTNVGGWQVWVPVAVAIVSASVSSAASIWAAGASRDAALATATRAYDAKMVELGVTILATDPSKSDVAPAREWAIGLIETHSGQKFTSDEHDKLMHQPIVYCDPKTTGSLDFSNPCNSGLAGAF